MPVELRDHQIEAVDAIVRGLDIPPGRRIPWNGLRGQAIAACGTGKTVMAAAATRRLVPHGRVLVLVPTLDLLTQTIAAWREVGHTGQPAVAVCSLKDNVSLWSMDVRVTTNPIRLAMWHASGPVTIYATYSSLGVLEEAFSGAYGQRMEPVDLAVIDEAHRTSGSLGKAWAKIHDQSVIPAVRRLYMTATPRIWQERPPSWEVQEGYRDQLPEEMAASMDDASIFGPVLYELSLADAVSRGLLARYQLIVVELTDPVVSPERLRGEDRNGEEVRGQRLGALQAAMLRTMTEHRLQRVITFHHRTLEAEAFAKGLPAIAQKLHTADPAQYPADVWSGWLQGEHEAEHRRRVLTDFAGRAGLAVLSNCKVLAEGVDIKRADGSVGAVDSVALLDPKGAPHDIVQAIGRALRQKPREGKLASLIVPIFLRPGERPGQEMFTSGSYKPLVAVLQALRAHDPQAVEFLAVPQATVEFLAVPQTNTPKGEPAFLGQEPQAGEEEGRLLLRFSTKRDPALIAQWITFNVIDTEKQDWVRGWAAARNHRLREGHLRVPFDHREGPYPLGHWISDQRKAYSAGLMRGDRAELLEGLGMVWDPLDAAWEENLAAAHVYFDDHHTLAAPRHATALDKPIGQWLSNQRRPGTLADRPDRTAALDAIDPDWNPAWPLDWQRHYAGVQECLDGGAQLADLLPGVTFHGNDIGRWLERQRQHTVWQGLSDGQHERLARLGIEPYPALAAAKAGKAAQKATGGVSGAFERGVAALRQFKAREGHLTVPRAHLETLEDGSEVKLGIWLSNTKTRRNKLDSNGLAALAELGLTWA